MSIAELFQMERRYPGPLTLREGSLEERQKFDFNVVYDLHHDISLEKPKLSNGMQIRGKSAESIWPSVTVRSIEVRPVSFNGCYIGAPAAEGSTCVCVLASNLIYGRDAAIH
jgi:hypothetical protein